MKNKMKKVTVSACVLAAGTLLGTMNVYAAEYSADDVWAFRALANVEEAVNIRSGASEDSAVVGYLSKAASADILERGETWSLVISGGVEGYVKNEFLAFGEDAAYLASVYGMPGVKTYWDGVSLFSEPNAAADIVDTAYEGEEFTVISNDGSWVAVENGETVAYVPAEDVLETTILDRAVSVQGDGYEEPSYEESYTEDSYSEPSYEESYTEDSYSEPSYEESYTEDSYSEPSYEESYTEDSYSEPSYEENYTEESYTEPETDAPETESSVSGDDRELLAGIIYCEAGNQSRDGKIAVGAVVLNRVSSGSFANSISGVIYESGQFSPAGSGWLDSVIANGAIPSDCYEAADAALAGENPVGGALYFNTGSGKGIKIGAHQFY